MPDAPPKTVRFAALIKNSGSPEQVTLWTPPKRDSAFMKAVKSRRVVTIIQRNVGTRKDYGVIGFLERPKAAYLVFPKPIRVADGTKVVGIKYEAIAPSRPSGGLYTPKPASKPSRSGTAVSSGGASARGSQRARPILGISR